MTGQRPSSTIKILAQMGYASRGVVYLVVGGLALLTAFGASGKTTDAKGALVVLYRQPLGEVLLILMAAGLIGYSVWRSIQSLGDTDDHGTSIKGLAIRGGLIVSAITHLSLAWWTVSFLSGDSSSSQSSASQPQAWLDGLAAQITLAVIALAVLGAGIAHIYKGYTAKFKDYMSIPPSKSTWLTPMCRFGLVARGVVWCVIASFMIQSALKASSGEIHGIADALDALRTTTAGPYLFSIVSAGLFAFGLYSLVESLYRKINPEQSDLTPAKGFN